MLNLSRSFYKPFIIVLTFIITFSTLYLAKTITTSAAASDFAVFYTYGVYNSTDSKFPGFKLNYRMYVPNNYDPSFSYPLVLYLHGLGESGTDNCKQVDSRSTITYQLLNYGNMTRYPCIIIAPQSESGVWFSPYDTGIAPDLQMAINLVNETCNKYNVDKNRLYITGYSYGGFGTWNAIIRFPTMFTAAVPICGVGDPSKASLIKNVPIWAFHSSDDTVVSVNGSREMVDALKAINGNIKYTEYQNSGHDCWTMTYSNPDLYSWLFRQDKAGELPQVPAITSSSLSSTPSKESHTSSTPKANANASPSNDNASSKSTIGNSSLTSSQLTSSKLTSSSANKKTSPAYKPHKGLNIWWILTPIFAVILACVIVGCLLLINKK